MQLPRQAMLLRVFMGEKDRCGDIPLYEAIVIKAREDGLAGATVLRGPAGYGLTSRIHASNAFRLSSDLPLIVEIVDDEAAIRNFIPVLGNLLQSGMVTLEQVEVLRYGPRDEGV